MPRIVHFEFSVDDPQRAASFYRDVFGWEINKWDGPQEYWLIKTGEKSEQGIDGGMMKRQEDWNQNVYNTMEVNSVDDFSEKITKKGGEIVMPKMAIPGVGWIAYFKDTEGNVGGIMQPDPSAN